MIELLRTAFIGGIGIALLAGPLGCFVVWQRMAYFGDTLAHSALLGVVLGVLFNINLTFSIVVVCLLLTIILALLQKQRWLAIDTLLGILAHSVLSLGLVILSFMRGIRIDLMSYLFGDLLAVNSTDLIWIWLGGVIIVSTLFYLWRPLVAIIVNEDLAKVEGIPVEKVRLVLMLLLALAIAIAMKIVGMLLIISLLIMPAASAQHISHSPEQMAIIASGFGVLAVISGLSVSAYWDTPSGPSIILCSACLFILALITGKKVRG